MLNLFLKKRKGFTLIELLVVIAIIGVLASIVLVFLSSARKKGRDAKRIADMKSIQLALEMYYDANNSTYPQPGANNALPDLSSAGISSNPTDPGTYTYTYWVDANPATTYVLRAQLEERNSVLDQDIDDGQIPTGVTVTGGCNDSASPYYYCLKP